MDPNLTAGLLNRSPLTDASPVAAPSKSTKPWPGFWRAVLIVVVLQGLTFAALGIVDWALPQWTKDKSPMSIWVTGGSLLLAFSWLLFRPAVKRKTGLSWSQVYPLKWVGWKPLGLMFLIVFGYAILAIDLLALIESVVKLPSLDILPDTTDGLLWSIGPVVIVAPFTEELLFRGQFLGGFARRYGPGGALVLSALLFGLAHFHPVQSLTTFVAGLIIGWFFLQTKSLLPGIFGHFINNALAIGLLLVGRTTKIFDPRATFLPLWLLIPAAVSLAVGLVLTFRSSSWRSSVPTAE